MKSTSKTVFWPCLVIAVATVALLVLRIPVEPPSRAEAAARQVTTSAPEPEWNQNGVASLTAPASPLSLDDREPCGTIANRPSYCPPASLQQSSPRIELASAADGLPEVLPEILPDHPLGHAVESEPIGGAEFRRLLTSDETAKPRVPAIEAEIETPAAATEARDNFSGTNDAVDTRPSNGKAPADPSLATPEPSPVVPEPSPVVPEPSLATPEPSPVVPEPSPVVPEPLPLETDAVTAPATPLLFQSMWPYPERLVEQLREVADYEASRDWAEILINELDLLRSMSTIGNPETAASLDRLTRLEKVGEQTCEQAESLDLRIALLRARYALSRRLAVWRAIHAAAAAGQNGVPIGELNAELLAGEVSSIEKLFRKSEHYEGWCQFLLLDNLLNGATGPEASIPEVRRLAREILARTESTQLADSQAKFLGGDTFVPLRTQLRFWAAEPLDFPKLLRQLEQYEQAPSNVLARKLADQWNRLRWTAHGEVAELARPLSNYYRNANLRLAVSGELLNRLLPIVQDMDEDVNEFVLGSRVFGRSRTSTQLSVRLIPDPHRWRLGLEARGEVSSETQARVGMVRLFNRGESDYLARQLLFVGRRGVELEEPEAGVDASTRLTGVSSDMDVVPLVGSFVRRIARSQAEARRHEAAREVERKIAWRARRRMAEEVTARVTDAEAKFDHKILSPLQEMQLDPVATQMMTTQERLIMRCRLAGHLQLAANTARPRAPADSLLSVQIHQSAGNNVVEQLRLDGKTYELRELYKELADRFQEGETEVPEDIPEGVTLCFAEEEAVKVQFQDGRALLSIRLAELDSGRRTWEDFEVRGYYRPETATSNADLVRDGTIELIGDKLGFRDQIALRAIFSKVLSKNRKLELIHEWLVDEPRLDDVRVTQFVIDNGWIGVALSSREERRDLVARPAEDDERRR